MEGMMKPHTCEPSKAPSPQAIHKDSHVISKFRPKIRIVHIFAPEIIKTDVANFRELVQRLTGKPNDPNVGKKKGKSLKREESKDMFRKPMKKIEFQDGLNSLGFNERIKEEEKEIEEEEEIWGGENSSGFLNGLGDLDSFIQGLNEFPLLPSNAFHTDVFRETHFS